jgi:hypothetical protein
MRRCIVYPGISRYSQISTGIILALFFLSMPLGLAYSHFESVKEKRFENVRHILTTKLEDYRLLAGRYPNSLETPGVTNDLRDAESLAVLRKMNYRRTAYGYTLSYRDGSLQSTMSAWDKPHPPVPAGVTP